jgi:hypothetical protein
VPLWPFDVAAKVCETVFPPLGMKPPLHARRLDFFRKSFRLSTERARRLLGFEPRVLFSEGARRTADWYEQAGLLQYPLSHVVKRVDMVGKFSDPTPVFTAFAQRVPSTQQAAQPCGEAVGHRHPSR